MALWLRLLLQSNLSRANALALSPDFSLVLLLRMHMFRFFSECWDFPGSSSLITKPFLAFQTWSISRTRILLHCYCYCCYCSCYFLNKCVYTSFMTVDGGSKDPNLCGYRVVTVPMLPVAMARLPCALTACQDYVA